MTKLDLAVVSQRFFDVTNWKMWNWMDLFHLTLSIVLSGPGSAAGASDHGAGATG